MAGLVLHWQEQAGRQGWGGCDKLVLAPAAGLSERNV